MSASLDDAPPGSVFFERVLWPHRSLPHRGFRALMLFLGLLSLAAGIGFVAAGAWPICGFFGLDVALLYLAFRISYRSARQRETLPQAMGVSVCWSTISCSLTPCRVEWMSCGL